MQKTSFIIVVLTTLLFIGCRYDKEEELYPPSSGTCATDNVSYLRTIVPLMSTYACVSCHHAASPAGNNITVNTYSGMKTIVDNGRLYGSITHAPGFIGMPLLNTKMNACDIAKIKAWIDAGAPNN